MYKIEFLVASHDCDTCGPSYAEGYRIYSDGKLVVDRTPYTVCTDAANFDEEDMIKDIFSLFTEAGVEISYG